MAVFKSPANVQNVHMFGMIDVTDELLNSKPRCERSSGGSRILDQGGQI